MILVDGREITDHSSYGTPLLIDTSSIERVDVVRGPSSVLYGTKAIGGVVNIITLHVITTMIFDGPQNINEINRGLVKLLWEPGSLTAPGRHSPARADPAEKYLATCGIVLIIRSASGHATCWGTVFPTLPIFVFPALLNASTPTTQTVQY